MKLSLHQKLNDLIKFRGEILYSEIKQKCESGYFGKYYKISNLERRLRKSESPDIEPIIERGFIKSYKWIGEPIRYKQVKVLLPNGEVDKIITLPL